MKKIKCNVTKIKEQTYVEELGELKEGGLIKEIRDEKDKGRVRIEIERKIYKGVDRLPNYYQELSEALERKTQTIKIAKVEEGLIVKREELNLYKAMLLSTSQLETYVISTYEKHNIYRLKARINQRKREKEESTRKKPGTIQGLEVELRDIEYKEERIKQKDYTGLELQGKEKVTLDIIIREYELESKREIQNKDILRANLQGCGLDRTGKIKLETLLERNANKEKLYIPKEVCGVDKIYNYKIRNRVSVKEVEMIGRKSLIEGYKVSLELMKELSRAQLSNVRRTYKIEGEGYNLTPQNVVTLLNLKDREDNILSTKKLKVKGKNIDELEYNSKNVYKLKKEIEKERGRYTKVDIIYIKRYEGEDLKELLNKELNPQNIEEPQWPRQLIKRVLDRGTYLGESEYVLSYKDHVTEKMKNPSEFRNYKTERAEAIREILRKVDLEEVEMSEAEYVYYLEKELSYPTVQRTRESQVLEVSGKYYRLVRERYKY